MVLIESILRRVLGLECGFTVNPHHSACELTRSLKSFDFALHNAARDVLAEAAIGGGADSSASSDCSSLC